MRQLESRMLDVVGLPPENCEPLRLVNYLVGEHFGPHHDAAGQGAIPPHTPGGPRTWTLYAFLTDVERGGELRFPALNISVEPRAGRAVLWPHLSDEDMASIDERTVHEGAPVHRGRKLGVNLHAHRSNLRTRVLAGCPCPVTTAAGDRPLPSRASSPSSAHAETYADSRMSHVFHYETSPGATPLHDLVGWGSLSGARRLLGGGAPVDSADHLGRTALHVAAGRSNSDLLRDLIAYGAAVDAPDADGATPLHEAAFQGQPKIAHALLKAGAAPDKVGNGGTSALHLAARHGHLGVAEALLSAGASTQIRDSKGLSPLHLAVRYGHIGVARSLLGAGASTDIVDQNGATPLHSAVGAIGHRGKEEALAAAADGVRLLLEAGAGPSVAGGRGITPLHLAAGLGRLDALRLLLEAGALLGAREASGATPLDLARRAGREEAAAMLLAGAGKEEL